MRVTCTVEDTGEDEHNKCEDGGADGADNIGVVSAILGEWDQSAIRNYTLSVDHLKIELINVNKIYSFLI